MPRSIPLDAEWDDVVVADDEDITDDMRLQWWQEMAALPDASPETQKYLARMQEIVSANPSAG